MPYDDETRTDTSVALSGAPAATVRSPSGLISSGPIAVQRVAAATRPAGEPTIVEAALRGLLATPKTLPPSLFYDEEGCRLFYEITKLPEYYLTRTEFRLLETTAPEVAARLPAGSTLVEYGASDETKAEMLLRETTRSGEPVFRGYVPIDVAGPELKAMRERMAVEHPRLTVTPVTADFMQPIRLPGLDGRPAVMGFFPGSTIGNLEPAAAVAFMRRARISLNAGRSGMAEGVGAAGNSGGPGKAGRTGNIDRTGNTGVSGAKFLLGFDTCRDPKRLVPAYDDAAQVTARFNLNLLVRLNREAGATFDPAAFAHRAVWNPEESRIEMHLVSCVSQTVLVAGRPIHFDRDETIHTENSYKYAPERMRAMIEAAGWSVRETWSETGPQEHQPGRRSGREMSKADLESGRGSRGGTGDPSDDLFALWLLD
jgi:L-histidine N-alpha-methyltransferase